MAETRYIEGQGRYALAEMVGRGGFATVWRARSFGGSFTFGSRGNDVAIKIIPIYSSQERSRAMREGQIAEGLRHKNIVETIEVIPGDTEIYLVTEYVRGLPLDEAARDYDVNQVINALAQVLEALVYAHAQGIIHRDIKPQNALVDGRGRVKLTDFGVAYRAGDTRLTRIGYAVGTPGYIAPEIMDGADPSVLSDIYAVGATARTLLAYQPQEPPRRLREFIDRATSPNPAHRPQSAWAALKLLTGRRAPAPYPSKASAPKPNKKPTREERRVAGSLPEQALRLANGLAASWLGYQLGTDLLLQNGAQAVGIAAGLGVAGFLLPRLAALGLVVALAVLLFKNGVGLGFSLLVPMLGGLWIAGTGSSRSASRCPLGPVLAIPLALVGLGAGLPLLFGYLMRPVGACVSAAMGAATLICYDLTIGDGVLPYFGVPFQKVPGALAPMELIQRGQDILQAYPPLPALAMLWAAMAGVVSVAEWTGRWATGLVLAAGGGALAYALVISTSRNSLMEAMTSLGLASIIYGVVRYLGSRVRG
ncbi:MAG TPA: serine/threonine-protein kinase [Rubrobacteraceae bacterium]|nr:serine/threonine-protein kinase [Rubrobacteraceae bacterium]